jgi:hypothetical protein
MYRPSSSFEQDRAMITPVRKFVALAIPWSHNDKTLWCNALARETICLNSDGLRPIRAVGCASVISASDIPEAELVLLTTGINWRSLLAHSRYYSPLTTIRNVFGRRLRYFLFATITLLPREVFRSVA